MLRSNVERWRSLTILNRTPAGIGARLLYRKIYLFYLPFDHQYLKLVEVDISSFDLDYNSQYEWRIPMGLLVSPPLPSLKRVKHRAIYAYGGTRQREKARVVGALPHTAKLNTWLMRDPPFLQLTPLMLAEPDAANLETFNSRNGIIGVGVSIRLHGTDDFLLESLDCSTRHVEICPAYCNWKLKPVDQKYMTEFVLPPGDDVEYTNFLLESLSLYAENLTTLTFTGIFSVDIIMPHFLSIISITILYRIPAAQTHTQFLTWLDALPNLQFLTFDQVTWVEVGAARTLVRKLYTSPEHEPFSWLKFDNALLYSWSHPWFLCFVKKGYVFSTPHIKQHPFREMEPMNRVGGLEFPYRISLSWMELEAHVEAVRAEVDNVS